MDVVGFPHQVGGHFGLLTCAGHVCKPLNHREFAFYSQMDPRLAPFTVRCCGRIKVSLNICAEDGTLNMCAEMPECHKHASTPIFDEQKMTFRIKKCGKVEAEKVTNAWAAQCQSKVVEKLLKGYDKWFILLEDIVSNFKKPCVIDLKMGQRQYGDECSPQKKLSQAQKCRQSTSAELGVRLVGLQLFDRPTQQYSFVNKYEGRRMDKTSFYEMIFKFFSAAGKKNTQKILQRYTRQKGVLIFRLYELKEALNQADGFRFFSSSLLIAYDGVCEEEESITVKMIDFAHSTHENFLSDNVYSGYLLGVDSLITILSNILASPSAGPKMVDFPSKRNLKRPYKIDDEEIEKILASEENVLIDIGETSEESLDYISLVEESS